MLCWKPGKPRCDGTKACVPPRYREVHVPPLRDLIPCVSLSSVGAGVGLSGSGHKTKADGSKGGHYEVPTACAVRHFVLMQWEGDQYERTHSAACTARDSERVEMYCLAPRIAAPFRKTLLLPVAVCSDERLILCRN